MKNKGKVRGPLLGAHMSIAGGVGNAFIEGKKVNCDAIQIFTKSSRQWASKPYSKEEIEQFHINRKETGIGTVVAHDSYLLNMGSPDAALRTRSVAAFIDELERCEILGVTNLIAHPGAHVGAGELDGIKTIARSLDEVHKACPGYTAKVTLEITAGQGSNLGYRFEQIGNMIDATRESDRLRVCFDTEHAFAAGYDIRTRDGYERTFGEFDEAIGIELLAAFHLNDSKKEFNSRVDRHEHIGKGFIGIEAFRMLVNDRRFWGLPMCLETPKGPDLKEDRENLELLRSLIRA
ncbi:MAG TPA: deoxyribonuclease IV [Candidatus Binatia bacterium]|jgi:deoxyribonuclease IV|nr:deoxyribonuclease IV [Candidatus Binatia bacterium]